jgi:hypothetical protein
MNQSPLRPPSLSSQTKLSEEARAAYFQALHLCMARFDDSSEKELLAYARRFLAPESFTVVENIVSAITPSRASAPDTEASLTRGFLTFGDLRFLCGYFAFLEQLGLDLANVLLEIRLEKRSGALARGYLGFGLVPLEASLLQGAQLTTLLWTHSEDLVKERFFGRAHGPYLCGSYPGRSKFFTSARSLLSSLTKAEAIAALGLQGYAKVEKPGPLYILQAKMGWEKIVEYANPKVALFYKNRSEDGQWATRAQFLESSLPGFTSGGLIEVVGQTFEVTAADLDDLRAKGIEIFEFD